MKSIEFKVDFPPSSQDSFMKLISFLFTVLTSIEIGDNLPWKKITQASIIYLIISPGFLLDFNSTIS
jgi:hypothetical protein